MKTLTKLEMYGSKNNRILIKDIHNMDRIRYYYESLNESFKYEIYNEQNKKE